MAWKVETVASHQATPQSAPQRAYNALKEFVQSETARFDKVIRQAGLAGSQ